MTEFKFMNIFILHEADAEHHFPGSWAAYQERGYLEKKPESLVSK